VAASGFLIEGLSGAKPFKAFEAADAFAKNELAGMVRRLAREAGTSARTVTIETEDQLPVDAGGHPIFIGRILKARLSGPPDRVVADAGGRCRMNPKSCQGWLKNHGRTLR
jgi:hypothetical protein